MTACRAVGNTSFGNHGDWKDAHCNIVSACVFLQTNTQFQHVLCFAARFEGRYCVIVFESQTVREEQEEEEEREEGEEGEEEEEWGEEEEEEGKAEEEEEEEDYRLSTPQLDYDVWC